MEVIRIIDHRIYPRKALADARHAYNEYCSLTVSPLGSDQARVTISVNPAYESDAKQIVPEFLNYLLDRSAEFHLETK